MNKNIEKITIEYDSQVSRKPEVGDIVGTTTSSFDYDGVNMDFRETDAYITVLAELVDSDYSEFEQETSHYGGNYGYDYYKVIEVL